MPVDPQEVLDFGASLLRDVAENMIGIDEAQTVLDQEVLERWALHVLIATPAPTEDDAAPVPGRDYRRARLCARSQLKAQKHRVTTTVDGLRDVIDTFTESFSSALREDIRSDRVAAAALGTLRAAAHGDDPATLKAAALSAVSELSMPLEDKRTNQRMFASRVAEKITPIRDAVEKQRRAPRLDPETGLLGPEDVELVAKVGEEAMALFLETTLVIVVRTAPTADAKSVADALLRCFPRRRDAVGRMDANTFVAVVRDSDARDATRMLSRVHERVPQVVAAAAASTREDDSPPALRRALKECGTASTSPTQPAARG